MKSRKSKHNKFKKKLYYDILLNKVIHFIQGFNTIHNHYNHDLY